MHVALFPFCFFSYVCTEYSDSFPSMSRQNKQKKNSTLLSLLLPSPPSPHSPQESSAQPLHLLIASFRSTTSAITIESASPSHGLGHGMAWLGKLFAVNVKDIMPKLGETPSNILKICIWQSICRKCRIFCSCVCVCGLRSAYFQMYLKFFLTLVNNLRQKMLAALQIRTRFCK